MRNGKGCQSCRRRHIKCVTDPGSSICLRCKESRRVCVFDPQFRFKEVRHVDTASQGSRSRTHLVYEDDQRWVPTREAVGFILEDGAGAEYGTADFIEQDERPRASAEMPRYTEGASPLRTRTPSIPATLSLEDNAEAVVVEEDNLAPESGVSSRPPARSPADASWQQQSDRYSEVGSCRSDAVRPRTRSSVAEDYTSPASLSELSRRHEGGRRLIWGTGEDGSLVGGSTHPSPDVVLSGDFATTAAANLSHREALLMQHFVQKLAPWIDCCDRYCHFAQEVPKRALRVPMVLYAILALSSRHQSLMSAYDELEASYYHGHCLEMVIKTLSLPESSYDDNLFATIICLRLYEELDEEVDDFLHLQGIGRLLSAMPAFAHSGGLAEAASWQALRQDIYVALNNKIPPSFDLDNYGRSRVFDFRDDGACANVVILLFARILQLIFSPSAIANLGAWDEIERSLAAWDVQRALIFQPLFAKDADPNQDQPFPVIRLINPAQVVALQYFEACLVLVRQHKPPDKTLTGFEAVKERRNTERELIAALLAVVGLAESNPSVENANFTAHHLLKSSGYHISNQVQRERSISILRHFQEVMGYRTHSTITLLRSQWQDLDGSVE